MKLSCPSVLCIASSLVMVALAEGRTRADLVPEDTLLIDLMTGQVVIEMFPSVAPKHVARIRELARGGLYEGVVFHRVIDGFMAQTGDVRFGSLKTGYNPSLAGMGGSDLADLPAEFSALKHLRGTASMARSSDPNSANSQFFICFEDSAFLDGQYTVWGQVVEGMEQVDKIKRGSGSNGAVTNPDFMVKMRVGSDLVLRVDDNASAGGDGTSWVKAYDSLSSALDSAGAGSELWVAEGSYALDGPLSSRLRNDVQFFGGFRGTETVRTPLGDVNATVLASSAPVDANASATAVQAQLAEANAKATTLEAEKALIESQLTTANSDKTVLQGQLESANTKITELEAEIATLQAAQSNANSGSGNQSNESEKETVPANAVSLEGWNWHKWPWVYSDADKDWLYYHCGSTGWAVWRHKDKKWYGFNASTSTWVAL